MTAVSEGLVVRDLEVSYGKNSVLRGVGLAVEPGEVVGLLGRNGAGSRSWSTASRTS